MTVITTIINGTKSFTLLRVFEATFSNLVNTFEADIGNRIEDRKDRDPRPIYNSIGRIITHAITTNRLPMKAAVGSLNSDVHLTIAIDAVELTPATISVAPVSPKDRAKAKTDPEKAPGTPKGNSIFLKVVRGLAPRVREAISKVVSIDRNFVSNVLTI
jgi:hypothetical protein